MIAHKKSGMKAISLNTGPVPQLRFAPLTVYDELYPRKEGHSHRQKPDDALEPSYDAIGFGWGDVPVDSELKLTGACWREGTINKRAVCGKSGVGNGGLVTCVVTFRRPQCAS